MRYIVSPAHSLCERTATTLIPNTRHHAADNSMQAGLEKIVLKILGIIARYYIRYANKTRQVICTKRSALRLRLSAAPSPFQV